MNLIAALRPLLTATQRWMMGLLGILSLTSGLIEAFIIVGIVRIASLLTGQSEDLSFDLPLLGTMTWTRGTTVASMLIAVGVLAATHAAMAHLSARISSGVLGRSRERLLEAYSLASWDRQASDRVGALQESASNLAVQTSMIFVQLSNLIGALLGLLALLAAALLVDVIVTLEVTVVGLLLFALLRPLSLATRRNAGRFVEANSQFSEQVSEWASIAMELRVLGVQSAELRRLTTTSNRTARRLYWTRLTGRLGGFLYKDAAILFMVLVLGYLFLADTQVDFATIGATILLIIRSLSYAQQTQVSIQQLNEQLPYAAAMEQRLQSLQQTRHTWGLCTLNSFRTIELQRVTYIYPDGQTGVTDISIQIDQGELIGVVGPSGSGKSTLIQVLLRLRPPTSGEIVIDGLDYQSITSADWHSLTAVVPQDARLIEGSVAENIRFFRPSISDDAVFEAARRSNLLSEIEALPNGFETVLGPGGAGLSGGQRQRLSIARALATKPQLLVLDEPTSALDEHSETLLKETITGLKGHVTTVVIAHRLTTLESCDRVIAMANGALVHIGTLETAMGSLRAHRAAPQSIAPDETPRVHTMRER